MLAYPDGCKKIILYLKLLRAAPPYGATVG
jgi:hypothetical protein